MNAGGADATGGKSLCGDGGRLRRGRINGCSSMPGRHAQQAWQVWQQKVLAQWRVRELERQLAAARRVRNLQVLRAWVRVHGVVRFWSRTACLPPVPGSTRGGAGYRRALGEFQGQQQQQ